MREVVAHPGAVGIVVLDDEEQLWFVRQPREAVGIPDMLEIPAGKLDVDGEDPVQAARAANSRRRSASRPAHWDSLGGLLHLAGLRERGSSTSPRHGRLGRRRAPGGRRRRAHRRRDRAGVRPRRDPAPRPGLQDAGRALPPEGSALYRAVLSSRAVATQRLARHGRRRPLHPGVVRGAKVRPMAVVDAPSHAPASAQPFEHLVLDFLAYLEFERGLSRNTLEAYRSRPAAVRRVPEGPRRTGGHAHRPRRASSPAGRRRWREAAGRAGDAAAQGRLPALVLPPPAAAGHPRGRPDGNLRAPKQSRRLPHVLSRDEVAKLLEQPRGTEPPALRDRALLELMYACGLRASEAIDLETTDLDLEAGILRARGKGSKERIVPVGSAATRAVNAYLGRGAAEARGRPASSRACSSTTAAAA